MKVINKLKVAGRMLLTVDGDVLSLNATKVRIDGKEYDFDIAYDMENAIAIKADNIVDDEVMFI